ncbi:hypothetical protein BGZ63DRAFT_186981 [Mariannaea sp. PMI_226]|nr:hypothetical protein BGZ63DRAFT_186981 [Mariannaea sp. PMI_226]
MSPAGSRFLPTLIVPTVSIQGTGGKSKAGQAGWQAGINQSHPLPPDVIATADLLARPFRITTTTTSTTTYHYLDYYRSHYYHPTHQHQHQQQQQRNINKSQAYFPPFIFPFFPTPSSAPCFSPISFKSLHSPTPAHPAWYVPPSTSASTGS